MDNKDLLLWLYEQKDEVEDKLFGTNGQDRAESSSYRDKLYAKLNTSGGRKMSELIKRQDAIDAVMQNYCYESDRLTALQKIPVTNEKEISKNEIMNFAVAVLAEVAELAKQEDAPIYEGDKEVDQWVRLSDVNDAINKCLN